MTWRLAVSIAILLPAGGAQAQESMASSLDHTKWKLQELKQTSVKLPERTSVTLAFEGDRYHFSGCNLISGRFRIDGQRIIAEGPASATMRGCPDDLQALDNGFTQLLNANRSIRIDHDQLTLEGNDGAQWRFQRQQIASKDAQAKFIYVAPFTKPCSGGAGPMTCLQIRDSSDEPWRLHHSGIIGFEHVPGIEYRLRIKEDRVARPPADGAAIVWYLDLVVEQKIVDRKAADDYLAAKNK
jgi:heat shock protein HslJ